MLPKVMGLPETSKRRVKTKAAMNNAGKRTSNRFNTGFETRRAMTEKSNIPAFKYICKKTPETLEEEELTAMFNEMFENPQALLPSFDDNYNKWIEYMFVSFVAHLDIPEYDHDANEALAKILEHINEA